jgi:methionyl aminopeptidase
MIILKTQSDIDAMCEAGRLSAKALRMTGEIVRPGISTLELDRFAEEIIRAEGGVPGFKGYGGFPGTVCASLNDKVVHGIPNARTILQEGDIVSIDTGAVVDGWYGDNAWTFPVGQVDDEKRRLLEVTEQSLYAGLREAVAGNHLGDIGHAVQSVAEAAGFGVVRNYVGHGIGRDMHEDPNVPNYGHKGRGVKLRSGMIIAIEPMVNAGTYNVHQGDDGWAVFTDDGRPSAHFEKTVAILEDGSMMVVSTENLDAEPGMYPAGERPLGVVQPA